METRRLIAGLACVVAGLVLVFLPQEMVPWLPGSQVAGGVLGISGIMFLMRAYQMGKSAPAPGPGPAAAAKPARNKRRRKKN